MKYSIVIPSFNHCKDLLKPCIESVIKYTDLNNSEIIIVANGCTDETKKYLMNNGFCYGYSSPINQIKKSIWFDKSIGYTKATNEGIKIATGEYIVLLNNDCVLLPQPINTWINQLLQPFKDDKMVGGTGPFLMGYPRFIVFFCAMIK